MGFDFSYNESLPHASEGAAQRGHKEVIEWLHHLSIDGAFSQRTMDKAAQEGSNSTVSMFKSHTNLTLLIGHFDIVKFLHYNRTEGTVSKQ